MSITGIRSCGKISSRPQQTHRRRRSSGPLPPRWRYNAATNVDGQAEMVGSDAPGGESAMARKRGAPKSSRSDYRSPPRWRSGERSRGNSGSRGRRQKYGVRLLPRSCRRPRAIVRGSRRKRRKSHSMSPWGGLLIQAGSIKEWRLFSQGSAWPVPQGAVQRTRVVAFVQSRRRPDSRRSEQRYGGKLHRGARCVRSFSHAINFSSSVSGRASNVAGRHGVIIDNVRSVTQRR